MKILGLGLLFNLVCAIGVAQQGDSLGYYVTNVSVGYANYALGDVHDFYDQVLDLYNEMGVYVPTEKNYPGNVIFGISVVRNIPLIMRAGAGIQYGWTKAYSGYEDYAGLLEVNAKVSMVAINGIVEKDLYTSQPMRVYAGFKGGIVLTRSSYTNSVTFKDYPGEVGQVSLSGHGEGYLFEGYLGIGWSISKFELGVTGGYRLSKVDHMHGKMTVPGEGSYSGQLELEHDLSGLIGNVVLGYRFAH